MPPNSAPTLLAVDLAQSVLHRVSQTGHSPAAYSAYGTAAAPATASLGFNGQRRESGNGHYLLGNGHRAYSPGLRRFCAPDRLSPFDAGGLNAYAYCLGDPINRTDPTGAVASVLLTRLAHAVAGVGTLTALSSLAVAGFSKDNKNMQIVAGALMMVGTLMMGASLGMYKRAMAMPRTSARDVFRPNPPWFQPDHARQNLGPGSLPSVRVDTPRTSSLPGYDRAVNMPRPLSPSASASDMVHTSHAQYQQALNMDTPPSYAEASLLKRKGSSEAFDLDNLRRTYL